jgi:ISXO2-like transposase domain
MMSWIFRYLTAMFYGWLLSGVSKALRMESVGKLKDGNHCPGADVPTAKHRTQKLRVVAANGQRKCMTSPFVVRSEAKDVELAMQHVSRKATMHADEASHWDDLYNGWQVGRINHRQAHATAESCTNQVESYFSHLRRMIRGQHHFVSADLLHQYANYAAWLEDHRRLPNGELAGRIGSLALTHPVSRNWKGYWQR